jgi:hypothetical protein
MLRPIKDVDLKKEIEQAQALGNKVFIKVYEQSNYSSNHS